MAKSWTDKYILNLKPRDKKYYDTEAMRFVIRVMPSGVKTFLYIYTINGKRQELNLGNYPYTKISEAREKHQDAFKLVSKGIDPKEHNKAIQDAIDSAEDDTFGYFAKLYLTHKQSSFRSNSWFKTVRGVLNYDLLPEWKDRDIKTIRRKEVIDLLNKVGQRSKGQVNNVKKAASGVFDYALQREVIESNPAKDLNKAVPALKQLQRERALNEAEVKHIWKAIDNNAGNAETKRALKLILVTAQRPVEVSGMHSREIQIGVNKPLCISCRGCGLWTIPKERTKNNKEHTAYLTRTALELIGNLDGYAFPSPRDGKPIERNSIAQMVSRTRTDKITNETVKPCYGLDHWTPHDLRRTAATFMAKHGQSDEVIDAVLGHSKQGVIKVYNRHDYLEEKKTALLLLEQELLKIVS